MYHPLECESLVHAFGQGDLAEPVLRGISGSFAAGDTCALMGPSGSGKTTLLSILGCMLRPMSGRVTFGGEAVTWNSPTALTNLRKRRLGFVFQNAQLLPFLNVQQNLEIVGRNAGIGNAELRKAIPDLLERLSIVDCQRKYPAQLSGGQRQRVAVARAVLHRPTVILADEPTAALDWEHGEGVVRLLIEQARQTGATILTVTHDARLLPMFGRKFGLDRGLLTEKSNVTLD